MPGPPDKRGSAPDGASANGRRAASRHRNAVGGKRRSASNTPWRGFASDRPARAAHPANPWERRLAATGRLPGPPLADATWRRQRSCSRSGCTASGRSRGYLGIGTRRETPSRRRRRSHGSGLPRKTWLIWEGPGRSRNPADPRRPPRDGATSRCGPTRRPIAARRRSHGLAGSSTPADGYKARRPEKGLSADPSCRQVIGPMPHAGQGLCWVSQPWWAGAANHRFGHVECPKRPHLRGQT